MSEYGRIYVAGSIVTYQPGRVDEAVPRGPWSFPIQNIQRIIEKTFPTGPLFDWFVLFSTDRQEFAVPTEAFEEDGLEKVLDAIGTVLGAHLEIGLANSTDFRELELFRRA